MKWNAADGLFTVPSDFEDREHTLILIKCAMDSCHLLKFVNLAACINIQTCGVFYIQLTPKAGALLENIKVWLMSVRPHPPYRFSPPCLVPGTYYDKKLISHG